MSFLTLNHLVFGYDKALSAPITFSANRGELIALMGANGSGKTTLLKTIMGLLPPLAGEVQFMESQRPLSQLISFISNGREVDQSLTVNELLSFGRYPYLKGHAKLSLSDHAIIQREMGRFELLSLATSPLSNLSDGMLKRAMIARAFVQETPIILLDEPMNYLDEKRETDLVALLHAVKSEKLIIFSTHNKSLATNEATRILRISDF